MTWKDRHGEGLRLHRGKLIRVEKARTETRLWTAPVIEALARKQRGRRIPCVLSRVWSGGAPTNGVRDLL